MSSRNWDRSPESESDKKFHDLRESGYKGPIDQDGNADTTSEGAAILRRMAAVARRDRRLLTTRRDGHRRPSKAPPLHNPIRPARPARRSIHMFARAAAVTVAFFFAALATESVNPGRMSEIFDLLPF